MEKKINKQIINPLTGGLYYDKKHRKNVTENQENTLNPIYRPLTSKLSQEERFNLISKVGEELIQPDELKELLKKNRFIYCYDGFEPSGRMHIAQGLLKVINVNRLIDSGCVFIFWVADWFALLNNKMMGDLEKIRVVGRYFIEIWKAAGMKMSNVKFLWASDFINQRPDEYWLQVMKIAKKNSLNRINKCSQIMGRSDKDELSVAQMFYPCMQCTDVFFMDIDICQLGMDQRKVNMLARECATDKKPIILSSHMLPGMKEGELKMSKSDPDNAIFMADSYEDIKRKVRKAFCPVGKKEDNVVLTYTKFIIFPHYKQFRLIRSEENGGEKVYQSYKELEEDYVKENVHPGDLKNSFVELLNKMLQPVRDHFQNDPQAKRIFELTKKYQKENEKYKKEQQKKMKQAQKAKEKALKKKQEEKLKEEKLKEEQKLQQENEQETAKEDSK